MFFFAVLRAHDWRSGKTRIKLEEFFAAVEGPLSALAKQQQTIGLVQDFALEASFWRGALEALWRIDGERICGPSTRACACAGRCRLRRTSAINLVRGARASRAQLVARLPSSESVRRRSAITAAETRAQDRKTCAVRT